MRVCPTNAATRSIIRLMAVTFLPSDDERTFVAQGLGDWRRRLAGHGATAMLAPFGTLAAQNAALHAAVRATFAAVGIPAPEISVHVAELDGPLPDAARPLGDAQGHVLHTFRMGEHFVLAASARAFKVTPVFYGSLAREVGRMVSELYGGCEVDEGDREGDIELVAVALGLGIWVAEGAYLFENGCCGGGCGLDLGSLRTGLSLPEACFALALDTHRRQDSPRKVAKHLSATQKAAFKTAYAWLGKQGAPMVSMAVAPA